MKKYLRIISLIALIAFIIFFSVCVYLLTPEEIVNKIGIHNTYIIIFFISLLGGFSAWTSTTFMLSLITFSLGGANPVLLGISSGAGLIISDMFMFYLISKGRKVITGKWDKKLDRISKIFKGRAGKLIPFIAYAYIITPLPNDFLIIFLAMIEYPRKKIYAPIILGNITFTIMVAVLASKGIFIFT